MMTAKTKRREKSIYKVFNTRVCNDVVRKRGNTATKAMKPATLEGEVEILVPLFINIGDTVKVDTRTGAYVERKKS